VAVTSFSESFEAVAADVVAVAVENVMTFNTHVPTNESWSLNLAAQQATFGDMTVNAVPLGTFSEEHKAWVWAWGNASFQEGDPALEASLRLREIGRQRDIPEFRLRGVSLERYENVRFGAERLALTATGLLGGKGYAGVTIQDFQLFLMADDPQIPTLSARTADQIQQVLENAQKWSDADPLTIAAGYVESLNGKYQQIPGGLAISLPDGPSATLIYGPQGLVRVDPPMIPLL
jgi:hypothetical protein